MRGGQNSSTERREICLRPCAVVLSVPKERSNGTLSILVPSLCPLIFTLSPALPPSYSSPELLCRKVEELEKILKKEAEVDEEVDILNTGEEQKLGVKTEKENEEDIRFYMAAGPACEFVRDTTQEIGVSFQPVEVEKNVYASPIEEMVLKAAEQFVGDILRDALAVGYQMTSHNR
ncbi:hypothetical protein FKM82_017278 [Ascaphus truei]